MLSFLRIFAFSFLGWVIAFGLFFLVRDVERGLFIAIHYIADLMIFGGLFGIYYKFFGAKSPLTTSVYALISILILEFILWVFIAPEYRGDYINLIDWFIPAIIIVSIIYLTGIKIKNN